MKDIFYLAKYIKGISLAWVLFTDSRFDQSSKMYKLENGSRLV